MGFTPLGENEGVIEVCDDYKGMSWWNDKKEKRADEEIFGINVDDKLNTTVEPPVRKITKLEDNTDDTKTMTTTCSLNQKISKKYL